MDSHARKFPLFALAVLLITICAAPALPAAAADSGITFSWTKILSDSVIGVDWSPDGTSIILDDTDGKQIELLNWQTGAIIWQTPFSDSDISSQYAFSARWSRDGKWIAATAEGKLYLIDPQTGDLHTIDPKIPAGRKKTNYVMARWGADSTLLAALDSAGYIDILATTTGEITQTIDIDQGYGYGNFGFTAFDWSPDGQLFAASSWSSQMHNPSIDFWDRSGHLLRGYTQESETDPNPSTPCLKIYTDGLLAYPYVEWANDSRTLVAAGSFGYGVCRLNVDGTIYDHPISDNGSSIFRWSPDQRWLVGTTNAGGEYFWITDAAHSYQPIDEQVASTNIQITSFAWSPDSQHLAVGTDHELWIGTLHEPEVAATPEATNDSP